MSEPADFKTICRAGQLALGAGHMEEAWEHFDAARALASTPAEQVEVWCGLGRACGELGRYGEAEVALRVAERHAVGEPALIARVRLHTGAVLWLQGEMKNARRALEEAQEGFKRLGLARELSVTLGNLSLVYLALGEYQRVITLTKESLALGESLGDTDGMVIDLGNLADCYLQIGAYALADEQVAQGLRLAHELGSESLEVDLLRVRGLIQVAQGEWDAGQALLVRACALCDTYRLADLGLQALYALGEAYLARGASEDALEVCARVMALAGEAPVRRAEARLLQGRAHLLRGESTEALVVLERGLLDAELTFNKLPILRFHAALAQLVAHPAIAQVHARIAWELVQQIGDALTDKVLQDAFRQSPLAVALGSALRR